MSGPRLTKNQKDAIVARYKAGEPVKDIAAAFAVDESYPALLAKRRGVLTRKMALR